MDYQMYRQITEKRSFTKPNYINGNIFENHNYEFLQIKKQTPNSTTNLNNTDPVSRHNYNQQTSKNPTTQSVIFLD